jgi:choline dehydrogenase-like flavoprotein
MSRRVDVAIVGSGASGSVMAFELARRGLDVAVLERGPRLDPQTFTHNELEAFPRLFKQSGLQDTVDHNVLILQGGAVGGSTVINNAIWMRPNLDRVLPAWEAAGAPVDRDALLRAYGELEWALHVSPIEPRVVSRDGDNGGGVVNRGASVFERGCAKLDIRSEYLHNNRTGCIGCGWCNYGCRYNRKTSMLVTYIPWAEARGVEVIDRCQDVRIERDGARVRGVRALRGGKPITVEAERVVVCAGAIGSSAVLLQSGINVDGRVGRGLHVLGGMFVTGETGEELDGYDGIGLVCVAHASDDYVLESYFAPPVQFSVRLTGWFLSHFDHASRYSHFIDGGVMVGTDPRNGRVWVDRRGRVRISLRFDDQDLTRLRRGLKQMARIYFAGGARKVFPSSFTSLEFVRPDDLDRVDELVRRPDDLLLGSGHPQGGNPMSEDPRRGVVDHGFRVHGFENLYIADTSVWPSNIWANCQATAMAMSHYAATFVAN